MCSGIALLALLVQRHADSITGRSECLISLGRAHELLCLCRDISQVRTMSEIAYTKATNVFSSPD